MVDDFLKYSIEDDGEPEIVAPAGTV